MKKQSETVSSQVDLGRLIEQLGPLNNRWRDGDAGEKVLTLWEMGEALLHAAPRPTDALLWEVQNRSYVTRNLLRYALILRREWKDSGELERLTQGLVSFTVFRESLPFLKADREGVDDATYRHVISQLRNPDTGVAIQYLKQLKTRFIARHHKKGAGVIAAQDQAVRFNDALARLEEQVASNALEFSPARAEALVALSQIAVAIATGEEIKAIPTAAESAKDLMPSLAEPLLATARGKRTTLPAFRKLVGAERLMQAADLLNSLRSESTLNEWRRRHGLVLSSAAV